MSADVWIVRANLERLESYVTKHAGGSRIDIEAVIRDVFTVCKVNGESKEECFEKLSVIWDSFDVKIGNTH